MKITKIIALILCLVLAVSSAVVITSAETSDRHKLTGVDLLKAYGIEPYGSDADVATAEISNGTLVIKWGESASYPKLVFTNVPQDLKKYTYQIDFITAEDTNNKANYMIIGRSDNWKELGFRTGEYSEGKQWANIIGGNLGLGSGADTFSFGTSNNGVDLTSISNAHPARHTFIVSVDATSTDAAQIDVVVDGINLYSTGSGTSSAAWQSLVGLSGWKTNTMAYDNIVIKDTDSGQVIWSENFDDHSYSSEIVNIDENNHGYTCVCGVSDVSEHIWDNGVSVEDKNSCQTNVSVKYTCRVCNAVKNVANPHKPGEQKTVAATCTEDGYTETVCTVCNQVIEHTVITKTGHSYGLWVITKEATATEDGEKQQTCETCGDVKSKVIEKLGGGDEVENTTDGANNTTDAITTPATTDAPADSGSCGGMNAVSAGLAVILSFGAGAVIFVSKKRN